MTTKRQYLYSTGMALLSGMTPFAGLAQTAYDATADMVAPSAVTRLADLQFSDIIAGTLPWEVVVEPFLQSRAVESGDAVAFGGTILSQCAPLGLLSNRLASQHDISTDRRIRYYGCG